MSKSKRPLSMDVFLSTAERNESRGGTPGDSARELTAWEFSTVFLHDERVGKFHRIRLFRPIEAPSSTIAAGCKEPPSNSRQMVVSKASINKRHRSFARWSRMFVMSTVARLLLRVNLSLKCCCVSTQARLLRECERIVRACVSD